MVGNRASWLDSVSGLDISSVRKYKANSTILFQGEIPPLAFVVNKGLVALYTINNNGDEQVIDFLSHGDLVPAEWIFKRSTVSLYYYRAFSDCELIAVSRDDLLGEINKNHILANKLLQQFVSGFISTTIHIHALEHTHSREKLIKLMHYLVLRFGVQEDESTEIYTIPFKLTQTQIASMIGLTRETVTIETMKLKKKGALKYQKGIYQIDLAILVQTIGREEFDALRIY